MRFFIKVYVIYLIVRLKGLEPPRPATSDPKSDASTNFATGAKNRFNRDVPTAHGSAHIAATKSISLTILEPYYSPSVPVCTLGPVPGTDNLYIKKESYS